MAPFVQKHLRSPSSSRRAKKAINAMEKEARGFAVSLVFVFVPCVVACGHFFILQRGLSSLFYGWLAVAMLLSVVIMAVLANHGSNVAYGFAMLLMTASFVGSLLSVALADEWLGKHHETVEDALAVASGETSPLPKRRRQQRVSCCSAHGALLRPLFFFFFSSPAAHTCSSASCHAHEEHEETRHIAPTAAPCEHVAVLVGASRTERRKRGRNSSRTAVSER